MVSLRSVACLALNLVICASTLTAAEEPVDEFVPPEGLAAGWFARIDTNEGRIIARLLPEQAPQAVAHFTALADGRLEWFDEVTGQLQTDPYYDGVRVHRVVAGQLFEAGQPPGVGRAAPELFVRKESGPINFSRPGRLGMVSDYDGISGVKFLVTAAGQNLLNRMSSCFGEVVSGLDVVERITLAKAHPRNGRPIDPPVIERIRIFSVGQVAPLPEPAPYVDPRSTPSRKPERPKPDAPPTADKPSAPDGSAS